MKDQYELEEWVWNQNDFDQMGWHDNPIYAMSFDDDVIFDLDYLLKLVDPNPPNSNYRFWISPATLIFRNPSRFQVDLQTDFVNGLEIANILRESINGKTNFVIEAQEGRIMIETEEFVQIIRRPPTLQISQYLPELERGETCFSTFSEKDFKPSDSLIEGRELSYKYDDLRNLKTKAEIATDEFNFDSLSPKDRILKQREFRSEIEFLKKKMESLETRMGEIYG